MSKIEVPLSLIYFIVSFLASVAGAICGIGGGMAGRAWNKRMDHAAVDKLFMGLMVVIILISISNVMPQKMPCCNQRNRRQERTPAGGVLLLRTFAFRLFSVWKIALHPLFILRHCEFSCFAVIP